MNLGSTINTSANEFVPAFSPDGHWMFFASDRPGINTFGLADIYRSYRVDVHDDFAWQTPVNLGPNVNSAADDNGVGYFDNGGAPQLFFGSGRLGGAARDLFLSHLQGDGTWGPAALIPELSSASTENRPSVRQDGLEIFFYSDRPGGVGSTDIWTATRAKVDDPWSTPLNVVGTVNSSGADVHPYLSSDGRTLVYSSTRAGGLGGSDLYTVTRNARLTVTADDKTRLFGEVNPALTYAISGFVGGETSTAVSGTAACSTSATQSSPAGAYPIACTVGSLSAVGYAFDSFVAGTLTVRYSSPCLSGPRTGPLHVAPGEAVCVGAGGKQAGPVTVEAGGSLDVEGGTITGPVVAGGAAAVRLCGVAITGPLTISGSTGPVLVGGSGCDPNTIVGPVRVSDNAGGVEVVGNRVVGPLRVAGNAAPVHATGNTVTGPATIQP